MASVSAAVAAAGMLFAAAAGADPVACEAGVAAPPPFDGSSAGGVVVHLTASAAVAWCPASLIEADSDIPPGTNYPLRSTVVSPTANPVSNAISINRLLALAGVVPETVSFTYVIRPSGTWATLSTSDVSAEPTFADGLKPIVWINGAETDYLRPLRSPQDTNTQDLIVEQAGAPIDLYVSSGPMLAVSAHATPDRVAVGRSVSFRAAVAGAAAGAGLSYEWSFQDGSSGSGATVTHAYRVAGTYYAVVTVRGSGDDAGGVSQPVPVTVGSPPTAAGSTRPGGSSRKPHAPAGGPVSSKPHAAVATRTAGREPSAVARASGSTVPAAPAGPATPAARPAARAAVTPPVAHPSRHGPRPIATPAGTAVSGRLIAGVVAVPPARLAMPAARSVPAPAPSGGGSLGVAGGLAGGGAIALLLACGAGAELRSKRRAAGPSRTV